MTQPMFVLNELNVFLDYLEIQSSAGHQVFDIFISSFGLPISAESFRSLSAMFCLASIANQRREPAPNERTEKVMGRFFLTVSFCKMKKK